MERKNKKMRNYAGAVGLSYSIVAMIMLWKGIEIESTILIVFATIFAICGPILQESCKSIFTPLIESEEEYRKEVERYGNKGADADSKVC